MPLSREMQRLRAEHAALVTMSRIILDMVRAPHPPPAAELATARGQLRENLVRHLKCEDWILYPRLMATGDQELMRITRDFEIEMGDLAGDFIAYDDKWTSERVAADWTDFCRETVIVFDLLAMRVEREERELYPLAETLYASGAAIGMPVMDGSTISS
jgi:hemerythrin-like domain-containing protein